jgi:hypothetical protein
MQIGTLLTGAGVATVIAGQSKCDNYLLIGDVDTANPLQGLEVSVGGKPVFSVANAATLLTAYAKWMQEMTAAVVGMCFKLGTGVINKSTTYRLTNAGATTPVILASSDAPDGVPFEVATDSINASSSETYDKFSALFLQTPANIASVDIMYTNGHREAGMTIAEVDARFALNNNAEADGRLGGVSVIDNTDRTIQDVRINTNNVGALTILIAKLPDEAFQLLKKQGKI